MKRIALILTVVVAMFALGWWARGARIDAGEEVIVRIDTVYYTRPRPIAVNRRPVTVNVPRIVFAPAVVAENATTGSSSEILNNSGNLSDIPTSPADSVAIELAIETRTYEDSLYRAQVSGPVIADLGPNLDWVEVRGRTVIKTIARPYIWEAGPAAGAWYCPAGSGVWLGAEVRRNIGRLSVGGSAGYDPRNEGLFVELRASLALWRR